MQSLYFKHKLNNKRGDTNPKMYSFYKISENGNIAHISLSKLTISAPLSMTFTRDFEASNEQEFEEAKKKITDLI